MSVQKSNTCRENFFIAGSLLVRWKNGNIIMKLMLYWIYLINNLKFLEGFFCDETLTKALTIVSKYAYVRSIITCSIPQKFL